MKAVHSGGHTELLELAMADLLTQAGSESAFRQLRTMIAARVDEARGGTRCSGRRCGASGRWRMTRWWPADPVRYRPSGKYSVNAASRSGVNPNRR